MNEGEITLVCGKPEAEGTELRSWTEVPLPQAQAHLRAFLQSRGHLHPRIQTREDRLIVDPGPLTTVESLELADPSRRPEGFDPSRKRGVLGATLTPALLNDIQDWTREELQNLGYPCPSATARASADSGAILLEISPGRRKVFGPVTANAPRDFHPDVLLRSHAFRPGEPFDQRKLRVSEDRLITWGTVERTEFAPQCGDEDEVPIRQFLEEGEPRLFTFSLLFNTEEIAQARFTLRQTRIGENASAAQAGLLASSRVQEVHLLGQWFYGEPSSRDSLNPSFTLRRQIEDPFGFWSQRADLLWRRHQDFPAGFSAEIFIGPQFEAHQVFESALGERNTVSPGLRAELIAQSLEFEVYRERRPQGFRARLLGTTAERGLGGDFTARHLQLDGVSIWNFENLLPPLWTLTFRGNLRTTMASAEDAALLPPPLRAFLGGNESVRGFSRLEIPGSEAGGLTSGSIGIEFRPGVLGSIEPFLFVDAGALGGESWTLDRPVYWSPGMGLGWRSPIGPFQATLAHGFISNPEPADDLRGHWQFFAGLGETF